MLIRCLSLLSLLPLAAAAQETSTRITITGRAQPGAAVAGFGNVPLAEAPLQASVFGSESLADRGIQTIGGLTRLDASIGEAYDAPGYWSIVQVRGYTLDNRFNYRRDGLPINAETAILLSNKERLEVLKGSSGIQAGSSAPGGLVNTVVKRPHAGQREALLQWRERGSVLAAADVGDRSGPVGWRVNAAYERLDPKLRNSRGRSALLGLAGDWQPTPAALVEAEVEISRFRQPSMAGYSLLGDSVPDARALDTDINLNHQPWGQPVVLNGNTGSLRWTQQLSPDWRLRVHGMLQRLRSDDRTAFPYGVYDAATYTCTLCDRFAPDGSFTYWQFVSDNERRRSGALEAALSGNMRTGPVAHAVEAGVLRTRYAARFQDQVFDIAGTGRIDGSLDTPPSPGFTDANTNRDERSTEAFLRDAMRWGATSLWAGVRHTRLSRDSERTSASPDGGLRPTGYGDAVTTPWLALAQQLTPATLVYASWGRGLESAVAPNRSLYANAGEALPALKSRQTEAGIKHAGANLDAALALFDIDRPLPADTGPCNGAAASCRYAIDGGQRHRGIEAALGWRSGAWDLQMSAMLLDAERHGSAAAAVNGTRPVNVPVRTLRLAGNWRVPQLTGLDLQAAARADSDRVVLPYDSGKRIGGWATVDLGMRWQQRLGSGESGGTALVWRVGVDNVLDRQAWKESPYQFAHAYLYPLQPRTWRASLQAGF